MGKNSYKSFSKLKNSAHFNAWNDAKVQRVQPVTPLMKSPKGGIGMSNDDYAADSASEDGSITPHGIKSNRLHADAY